MRKVLSHVSKRWRRLDYCCFSTCSIRSSQGQTVTKVKKNLPQAPARTRFAPSPTGYLHLGSLRTALFNYLLAKSTGGQFLLRIEDTDRRRTLPDAEERLCSDLRWAGLQWDEGPQVGGPLGPYQQSKRTALYREHAELLLKSRHAYRCFCTSQRLHELAEHRSKLGLPTDYDRACLSIPQEESDYRAENGDTHVIRLKVPDKYPKFQDLVYGKVGQKPAKMALPKAREPAYEDPILLKSDGHPTYHLANVVDDHYMEITHVVRASEWMSSTPKHLAMYEAFKWQPPAFAHVGLLQNADGQKLSKRNLDTDVSYFRDTLEILPEALVNYVALLGWSHGRKNDLFTLKELIDNFELKFTKGNTIVTDEKLRFLQRGHMRRRAEENGQEFEDIVDRVFHHAQHLRSPFDPDVLTYLLRGRNLRSYIAAILRADAKNFTDTPSFFQNNSHYFERPTLLGHGTVRSEQKLDQTISTEELRAATKQLDDLPKDRWTALLIKERIFDIVATSSSGSAPASEEPQEPDGVQREPARSQKEWSKALHHYLRWSIAGGKQGPGISETMEILGREESLFRLQRATECS